MVQALADFQMLEDGDRVLVAVSGGKDSTVMALLFSEIQKKALINFSFSAVILDQKQIGFRVDEYKTWLEGQNIPLKVIEEDTYSIVKEKVPVGKTSCGLCSRLRRGILYNYAFNNGFNKIALGHHRDDFNETLLLNLLYTGKIASMPPKLMADDKRNIVIRPLMYVKEEDISAISDGLGIPLIPCNLCGSQSNLKRKKIKTLLSSLEEEHPGIASSIFKAQENIKPSQLSDSKLWNFEQINSDVTLKKKPEERITEGP